MTRRKGAFVKWKSSIPEEIALRVELRLYNHADGKPEYAARSALITSLLEQWLADCERKDKEANNLVEVNP